MSERFPRPVVCEWCGNRYRSVIGVLGDKDDHTQGDCCAASCWQDKETGEVFIQGHYGSTNYDTDRFRFLKNAPTERADVVCDNCIGERLCVGDLERLSGSWL